MQCEAISILQAVAVAGGHHSFDIFLLETPIGSIAFFSKQPLGPEVKPWPGKEPLLDGKLVQPSAVWQTSYQLLLQSSGRNPSSYWKFVVYGDANQTCTSLWACNTLEGQVSACGMLHAEVWMNQQKKLMRFQTWRQVRATFLDLYANLA